MTTEEKKIKEAIIDAIIHGRHGSRNIISYCHLERKYREFCRAIAELQMNGIIEYHNRNEAKEYGYFLTEKAYALLPAMEI